MKKTMSGFCGYWLVLGLMVLGCTCFWMTGMAQEAAGGAGAAGAAGGVTAGTLNMGTPDMGAVLTGWLVSMVTHYPKLAWVVFAMGAFRVCFKPLFAHTESYLKANNPEMFLKLQAFESGPVYKFLAFLADYLLSVKLPLVKTPGSLLIVLVMAGGLMVGCAGQPQPGVVPVTSNPVSLPGSVDGQATASSQWAFTGTNGVVYLFGHAVDPVKTAKVARELAKTGAVVGVGEDQNARAYILGVANIIDVAIDDGNYDADDLSAALSSVSMTSIKDHPDIKTGIIAVFSIYSIYSDDILGTTLDKSLYLRPVLQGISTGLKEGAK